MARRPEIEINLDVMETMMQYGATCKDIAGRFMCSPDTIIRRVKEEYGTTFAELSDKLMFTVRMKLREKMYDSAMAGNTAMLIWLSKQWLGMKEQGAIEHNIKDKIEIVIK
jgi:hypothetical protein